MRRVPFAVDNFDKTDDSPNLQVERSVRIAARLKFSSSDHWVAGSSLAV